MHADNERHEQIQKLQTVLAKKDEQLEKGGSIGVVQNYSTSSTGDKHLAEAEVSCIQLDC